MLRGELDFRLMLAHTLLLAAAGLLAGGVNAVAGGGSLLVFPALLATGLAPLPATVTNSVTQGPGFLGATLSQRADLRGQRRRMVLTSVATVLGTLIGCALLLLLPGEVFEAVVPALLVVAAALMAFQHPIQRWLSRSDGGGDRNRLLLAGTFLVSIYGGYFGGARSIVLLAVLMLTLSEPVRRLSALKNWLALVDSAVTLVVYALLAPVHWVSVLVLVPTTVIGGYAGGKLARHLSATALRYAVVVFALAAAVWMMLG